MLTGSTATQRAEQARRKSVAQQEAAADDRNIRFTIGGVGQRMTKEDFIREVRKLDETTRKDVVDQSSASNALKRIARNDPALAAKQVSSSPRRPPIPQIVEHGSESSKAASERAGRRQSESVSPGRRPDPSSSRSPPARSSQPSEQQGETAIERKRRLAVLASQNEEEDTGETPAERRRREAALGMEGGAVAEDSDSEDEGEPRVPPVRRGIRFAEPDRGRRGA
jgi:hypothetical protein